MSLFRIYEIGRALFYTLYLKCRFGNRIKLKGFIKPEGNVNLHISKNGFACIKGNITLREGTTLLVREGANLTIGDGVFFNRNCSVVCRKEIKIGKQTLFGECVKVYDNDHSFGSSGVDKSSFESSRIFIGERVWVANNVNILKGSKISDFSVVGAMSLVKGNLEESGVYVGIPARLVKKHD